MKIAVLLATFNRKDKTLACLKNLWEQELPEGVQLEAFITDDASADGTAEAVQRQYPQVHLYPGNGNLYWAGGMRRSWEAATETNPDFYLLLNDDTFIIKDAIKRLLLSFNNYSKKSMRAVICVGRTKDPDSGNVSYGGRKLFSKRRLQSYLIPDVQEEVECDTGEGNIMLVPKAVVEKIGMLSDRYTHTFADIDYTLRAKKAGFKVVVPPGVMGDCKNDHGKSWKSPDSSLTERLEYLFSPKGLAYKDYMYFMRQHFPLQIPAALVKVWLKTLFPAVYDRFKKTGG